MNDLVQSDYILMQPDITEVIAEAANKGFERGVQIERQRNLRAYANHHGNCNGGEHFYPFRNSGD